MKLTTEQMTGLSNAGKRERLLLDLVDSDDMTLDTGTQLVQFIHDQSLLPTGERISDSDASAALAVASVALWVDNYQAAACQAARKALEISNSVLADLVRQATTANIPGDVFLTMIEGNRKQIIADHPEKVAA